MCLTLLLFAKGPFFVLVMVSSAVCVHFPSVVFSLIFAFFAVRVEPPNPFPKQTSLSVLPMIPPMYFSYCLHALELNRAVLLSQTSQIS